MLRPLLFAALIVIAFPALAENGGPSFDCTKAASADENAICSTPELASMDLMIEKAYATYRPEFGERKVIARALLADRRACGADTACIAAVLYNSIDTFLGIDAAPGWIGKYVEALLHRKAVEQAEALPDGADQPMPETIGDCAVTTITTLMTRSGALLDASEEAGAGTIVEFSNGGHQVSYSREETLVASKVGERAAICLLSTPRDCPDGDDRGRVYLGVNLFTQGTWALSDSQHSCGGA